MTGLIFLCGHHFHGLFVQKGCFHLQVHLQVWSLLMFQTPFYIYLRIAAQVTFRQKKLPHHVAASTMLIMDTDARTAGRADKRETY